MTTTATAPVGRNTLLAAVLAWAEFHGVDLDRAHIDLPGTIYFFHHSETAANMRAVKRAVDGFRALDNGESLRATATLPNGTTIGVSYLGAYQCERPQPVCKPVPFHDGAAPVVE